MPQLQPQDCKFGFRISRVFLFRNNLSSMRATEFLTGKNCTAKEKSALKTSANKNAGKLHKQFLNNFYVRQIGERDTDMATR
jgi:hypothetical protein